MRAANSKADKIELAEFMTLNRRYPVLLAPARQLQDSLRGHVMGQRFWRLKLAQRSEERRMAAQQRRGVVPTVSLSTRMMRAAPLRWYFNGFVQRIEPLGSPSSSAHDARRLRTA